MSPARRREGAAHRRSRTRSFAPVYYFHGDDDYVKDEELRRLDRRGGGSGDARLQLRGAARRRRRRRDARLDRRHAADDGGAARGRRSRRGRAQEGRARDARQISQDAGAGSRCSCSCRPRARRPTRRSLDAHDGDRVQAARAATRIPKWIAYYVEHDLASTITEGAITLLQEAVGTELAQLKIELDKLVELHGRRRRSTRPRCPRSSAFVPARRWAICSTPWRGAMRRRALAMVPAVLQQPKSGGVPIVHGADVADARHRVGAGGARARREPGRLNRRSVQPAQGDRRRIRGARGASSSSTCARAADSWTRARRRRGARGAARRRRRRSKTTRLSSDEQLISQPRARAVRRASRRRAA